MCQLMSSGTSYFLTIRYAECGREPLGKSERNWLGPKNVVGAVSDRDSRRALHSRLWRNKKSASEPPTFDFLGKAERNGWEARSVNIYRDNEMTSAESQIREKLEREKDTMRRQELIKALWKLTGRSQAVDWGKRGTFETSG
jgi:hypothetical protein